MGYDEMLNLSAELIKSFDSLRAEVSHLLKDKDQVTIRFTYHVRTVENPDEEIPMAHFIAIWQVKDGKLYKGYQISQQADESPENLSSFLRTNI
jgi:ketosteroid isomerase-like protein